MAHEPFWWHAYAYDTERMDTLSINRVNTQLQQIPKNEAWLHLLVDQTHWYYANDNHVLAELSISDVLQLLASGEINTTRPAYWYYGFLNLLAEKRTNRLAFSKALTSISSEKAIPTPANTCLPCMAIDFTLLKLMAKSSRFLTDFQYQTIAAQFNAAYALNYTEIQGILAGYLIHAKERKYSNRINDINVDIPTLLHELPPRPKTRILVSMAPKAALVGVDSTKQFWQEVLALGGSKNLFALFRGNIELGLLFERNRQIDSAGHYYLKALDYALQSHDLEAEVHVLGTLKRLHQQDPAIPFADSLSERHTYLYRLQRENASKLREIINSRLITELEESNTRLSKQNTLITALLVGVGILFLGLTLLLRRLYKQRKALSQANMHKTWLYGMIAHDLRSPLSTFNSILMEETSDTVKLTRAKKVISRLQWLLDDMLKWTFTQQKQLSARIAPTDIVEIIEENLLYYLDLIALKNIQLAKSLQEELPAAVDREMTSTILRNLMQNAVKHNYTGGYIHISSTNDNNNIVLTIENSTQLSQKVNQPSLGKDLIQQFASLSHITISTQQTNDSFKVTLCFPAIALKH